METSTPVRYGRLPNGQIAGSVGVGDRRSCVLLQAPTSGAVDVRSDGRYLYTPFGDLVADRFVVGVVARQAFGTRTTPVGISVDVGTVPGSAGGNRSFQIRNGCSTPVVFTGYAHGDAGVEDGPGVGTAVMPGASITFTLRIGAFERSMAVATLLSTAGRWQVVSRASPCVGEGVWSTMACFSYGGVGSTVGGRPEHTNSLTLLELDRPGHA